MWSPNITFWSFWFICGSSFSVVAVDSNWPLISYNISYFSDPFSLSDCWIAIILSHLVYFINCTIGPLWCVYLTSVGRKLLLNIITLQGSGFLDSVTRLVYLIIVLYGLFVSEVHCLLITFLSYFFHNYFNQIAHMHPFGQFHYCT